MAKNVEALRTALAQAQQEQDAALKRFREAERKTKAAGRELVGALAAGLDLSPAERKALGLKKGGPK